jgi:hypothetical protein
MNPDDPFPTDPYPTEGIGEFISATG